MAYLLQHLLTTARRGGRAGRAPGFPGRVRQLISTRKSLIMARPPAMPVAQKVRIVLPFLAAPILARLPAALGYRIACWNGDLLFRYQAGKRTEMERNLQLVLGNDLSPAAAQQVARDWFRLPSCRAVDVNRLRRGAGPLRRLVEIRGREHLEAALAAGKGAILCSAHFGSHDCGFSVLHASGFPVTTIGRWQQNYNQTPAMVGSHPPSGGSGNWSTPGGCGATGSGRTSSPGPAGSRSRRRPRSCFAPMRW